MSEGSAVPSVRDVIVVGAGPAGLASAIAATQAGLDCEVIEQTNDVLDEAVSVRSDLVRLVTLAVAAQIKDNNTVLVIERIDQARLRPGLGAREPAVDQHHRLAIARTHVDVADLHAL